MVSIGIEFALRCLLLTLFLPFSALDKVLNFREAVAQAGEITPSRGIAVLFIAVGLCIEVLMSIAILSGAADRLAALVFAGYCVATAALFKRFWKTRDFRLRGPSRGREVFWDFLKNLALGGGFLLLAFGASASNVDAFFANPLASSHPYRSAVQGDASR